MYKKFFSAIPILLICLAAAACGAEETDLSVSSGSQAGSVPVAEFMEMKMPVSLRNFSSYVASEEHIYFIRREFSSEDLNPGNPKWEFRIYKGDISEEFDGELYVFEKGAIPLTLLPDRAGNCFIFAQTYAEKEKGEESVFFLEKYDEEGNLLWHNDYSGEQLQGKGEKLTSGTVTEDGRVFLCCDGEEGAVFCFDGEGNLQEERMPRFDILDGIAAGKDNRVYGYCITGEEAVFIDLEGTGESRVCPFRPLRVYEGYEEGIYLCTGEGLHVWDPETGEDDMLWAWNDDYIQMDFNCVEQIYRGNGDIRLIMAEYDRKSRISTLSLGGVWDILTFASVDFRDGGNYPPKRVVTVGTTEHPDYCYMTEMVRRYNRQSVGYKAELTRYSCDELDALVLKGEAPDVTDICDVYAQNLAEKGAFEDLTPYYEQSGLDGELLESVKRAGIIRGRNVGVIPAFSLSTTVSRVEMNREDWTPAKFYEMAQNHRMLPYQTKWGMFWSCMMRAEDRFVDYEKREAYFDGEEFRGILETCDTMEALEGQSDLYGDTPMLEDVYFHDTANLMYFLEGLGDSGEESEEDADDVWWVGDPGWDGGVHNFMVCEMLTMNSASKVKEGAWDFLQFVLSKEMQDHIDWGFPARKDSFEYYVGNSYPRQDAAVCEKYKTVYSERPTPGEEEFAIVREIAENASYQMKQWNFGPVNGILYEEVLMYFEGDATLDETVKKIQNRVRLYLDEL